MFEVNLKKIKQIYDEFCHEQVQKDFSLDLLQAVDNNSFKTCLSNIPFTNELSFSQGIGLFETIKIATCNNENVDSNCDENMDDTYLDFLDEHITRIIKGVKELLPEIYSDNLDYFKDVKFFKYILNNFLHSNKYQQGAIKLVIAASSFKSMRVFINYEFRVYQKQDYETGFTLKLVSHKRNNSNNLLSYKTLSNMENMYILHQVRNEGANEALFLNTDNYIAEGSISNIFWIKDKTLYTPSCSCGILPGIMRNATINKYLKLGYEVLEGEYPVSHLKNADRIFITNSLMGEMKVTNILF